MNWRSIFCHGEEHSDVAIHALHIGYVYLLVDCRGRPAMAGLSRNDKQGLSLAGAERRDDSFTMTGLSKPSRRIR